MSRLYLLRHAKAVRPQPEMRDFDRPLEEIGRAEATKIGTEMHTCGYAPDVTLCSGSLRTRQTLEAIASQTGTGRAIFSDALYSEGAKGYLELIKEHAAGGSILVIGHNPSIENLATKIVGEGETAARLELGLGFPTAGLAVIDFRDGLAKAGPESGYLEAFHTPHPR